jgi:DNA-binding NarL/FixJ family response regulator
MIRAFYSARMEQQRPLRLAIVDDYEVVVAGVAALLEAERIDVVETAASLPVISDVDVVLYDTFGHVHGLGPGLEDFVAHSGAKVVIYSWNLQPRLIKQAMARGASGYLSKVLTGPVIVEALERIVRGETVILTGDNETSVGGAGDWPGRSAGLSSREAEVIAPHRKRPDQSGDRRAGLRQPQHSQDLHSLGLSQDRRRASLAGSALGGGERLSARHRAHARSSPTNSPPGRVMPLPLTCPTGVAMSTAHRHERP